MDTNRFRIPVAQLEDEMRVARPDQVVLVGDGATPPAVTLDPADGGAGEGDGD